MEAKAIQLIQDTALLAHAKMLGTFTPVLALPSDTKLHNIEKYEELRSRFRGSMLTHSLKDFANYVITTKGPAAVGFVDGDTMACTVYFNLGDTESPGHGDYSTTLTLKKTAAFLALEQAAQRQHAQKDLSDWIEDWAPNLKALDADDQEIDLRKAAGAIRSISIEQARKSEHVVGDMSASRSAMDQIEAKSSEGLPAEFLFTVAPYEGLIARTIRLRVAVLTGGDKPTLRLRWIGEAQLREDLAQEFKQVVQKEVGGSAILTIGTFNLG